MTVQWRREIGKKLLHAQRPGQRFAICGATLDGEPVAPERVTGRVCAKCSAYLPRLEARERQG